MWAIQVLCYVLFRTAMSLRKLCGYVISVTFNFILKKNRGSSHCGSAVTNPTSIHEDAYAKGAALKSQNKNKNKKQSRHELLFSQDIDYTFDSFA